MTSNYRTIIDARGHIVMTRQEENFIKTVTENNALGDYQ
jgi:hypothetical protein